MKPKITLTTGQRNIPKERPFVCAQCGKAYTHRSALSRHLNLQCGKLPQLQCKKCSKLFYRKDNLLIHVMTCSGVI